MTLPSCLRSSIDHGFRDRSGVGRGGRWKKFFFCKLSSSSAFSDANTSPVIQRRSPGRGEGSRKAPSPFPDTPSPPALGPKTLQEPRGVREGERVDGNFQVAAPLNDNK